MPDLYKTLQKFYDGLGDEEEFKNRMQNEDDKKALYDSMKENGIDTDGYDEFAGYEKQQTPTVGEASGKTEGTVVAGQVLNQIQPGTNSTKKKEDAANTQGTVAGGTSGNAEGTVAVEGTEAGEEGGKYSAFGKVDDYRMMRYEVSKIPGEEIEMADGSKQNKAEFLKNLDGVIANMEKYGEDYVEVNGKPMSKKQATSMQRNEQVEMAKSHGDFLMQMQSAPQVGMKLARAYYGDPFKSKEPTPQQKERQQEVNEQYQKVVDMMLGKAKGEAQGKANEAFTSEMSSTAAQLNIATGGGLDAILGAKRKVNEELTAEKMSSYIKDNIESLRLTPEVQKLAYLTGKKDTEILESLKQDASNIVAGELYREYTPKSNGDYYMKNLRNSGIGRLVTLATEPLETRQMKQEALDEYGNQMGSWSRFGSDMVNMGVDMFTTMPLFGKVGQGASKILTGGYARKLVATGVEEMAAARIGMQTANTLAQRVMPRIVGSSFTFGTMDLYNNITGQLQQAGEVNWKDAGVSGVKGLGIGAVVGVLGEGVATAKVGKGALAKTGITAAGIGTEAAIFTASEVFAEQDMSNISWEDVLQKELQNIAMVGYFKMQEAGKKFISGYRTARSKGAGFKDGTTIGFKAMTADAENVQLSDAEIKSLKSVGLGEGKHMIGKDTRSVFLSFADIFMEEMDKMPENLKGSNNQEKVNDWIMKNTIVGKLAEAGNVPESAKNKLIGLMSNGVVEDTKPTMATSPYLDEDGKVTVDLFDMDNKGNQGRLVERVTFETEGEANKWLADNSGRMEKNSMAKKETLLNVMQYYIDLGEAVKVAMNHYDITEEEAKLIVMSGDMGKYREYLDIKKGNKKKDTHGAWDDKTADIYEFIKLNAAEINRAGETRGTLVGKSISEVAGKFGTTVEHVKEIIGKDWSERKLELGEQQIASAYMDALNKRLGIESHEVERATAERNAAAEIEGKVSVSHVANARTEGEAVEAPEEKVSITRELNAAEDMAAQELGTDDVEAFVNQYGDTAEEQYEGVMADGSLTNSTKKILQQYIVSKERFEGMISKGQEAVEASGKEAEDAVDGIKHEDGNVYFVHHVKDTEKSGTVILGDVNDPKATVQLLNNEGQPEQVYMSDLSIDRVVSADEYKAEKGEEARQAARVELGKQMDPQELPTGKETRIGEGQRIVAMIDGEPIAGTVTKVDEVQQGEGGSVIMSYGFRPDGSEKDMRVAAENVYDEAAWDAEEAEQKAAQDRLAERKEYNSTLDAEDMPIIETSGEVEGTVAGEEVQPINDAPKNEESAETGDVNMSINEGRGNAIEAEGSEAKPQMKYDEEGIPMYEESGVDATLNVIDEQTKLTFEEKKKIAGNKLKTATDNLVEAIEARKRVEAEYPEVEGAGDDWMMLQAYRDAWEEKMNAAKEAERKAEASRDFWNRVYDAMYERNQEAKKDKLIWDIIDQMDENTNESNVGNWRYEGRNVDNIDALREGMNYEGVRMSDMSDAQQERMASDIGVSVTELKQLDAIGRDLGIKIGFADYIIDETGSNFLNAQVERGQRAILVSRASVKSAIRNGELMSFFLGHEFTHQQSADNAAFLKPFIAEARLRMGKEFKDSYERKAKFYKPVAYAEKVKELFTNLGRSEYKEAVKMLSNAGDELGTVEGAKAMAEILNEGINDESKKVTAQDVMNMFKYADDTINEEIASDFGGKLLSDANYREQLSGISRTWKEKLYDFAAKMKGMLSLESLGGSHELDDAMAYWGRGVETNGRNRVSKNIGNSSVTMEGGNLRYNVASRRDEKALLDAVLQTNAGKLNRQELEDMKKIGDAMMEGVVGMMAKHPAFAEWNERMVILDKNGNPAYTAFINNSDTEAPTIELSRNCVKKEAMNSLLTLLRHEGLLNRLNNVSYQDLREVLKKHGYAIACEMCYVESKRENVELKKKLADAWNSIAGRAGLTRENFMIAGAQELTDKQEAVLRSIVDKYGKQKREGRIANLMLEYPELRGTMDHEYMYTPEGWDEIVQKFGDEHEFMGFLASSDGAATAKPTFGSQPFSQRKFVDQFSELSQYFGEAGIKFGGFRKHSFSDADPLLFVDDYQIHENLAATHSGMFGYTKVPYYVDMWGETGEFINESLVLDIDPERRDARENAGLIEVGDPRHQKGLGLTDEEYDQYKKENGLKDGDMDYYFAGESFPVRQAFAFRNEARFGGRVGTVLVAPSDAVIEKALDDERIDIIIGYHVSNKTSANKQRAGYHLATDYAGVGKRPPRNETVGNKGMITSKTYLPSMGVIAPTYLAGGERDKYVKFNYNEACQQYGDAKTAAKAYLEWCDENGFTPMYEKFRGHENYYKLLNDFRRYDGEGKPLVQGAIKMQLPEDWAEKLDGYLTEREAEHEKNTSLALNKELLDDVREIMGVKKGRSYSVNEGIYDSGLNSEENPLKDAEKAVPLRGAQWWLTPEQREASREKHKNDGNMKLKDLAFLSDASKEGVKFTYDELIAIPEIAEAQEKLDSELLEKGSLDLKEAGLDAQQFVDKLLDEEHGSFTGKKEITTENGEKKKVEMFDGEVAQERKAFFVIGRPAGGKSSVYANPLSRDNKARIVDSDVVKPWLPGFDGGDGAGYVNKASSDIAEVAVWQSAERGDNMVIPKIGGDSVLKDAIKLKQMFGYKVYLYYNDVPAEASYTRSMARYAETGRYLSLNYLKDGVGEKPSKTFHNSTGSVIDVVRYLASKESKDRGYWENYLNELENGRRNVQDAGVQDVRRTGRMASGQQHGSRDESLRGESGEVSRLFEYVEWKSNDVGIGQEPRLVWSTESGVPMPETAEVGNDYYEKTNQFKGFFGDWEKDPENASKVVDENGKPLVLHHGTPHYGYTVFDTRKNREGETTMGSHFGSQDAAEDRLASKRTGKDVGIYDVYLNIRNPWECTDWFDMNDSWAMADLAKLALEHKDNAKVQDMWNILKRFESWAGKYTDEELSKAKFYYDGIKGLESYKEYDMGTFHNFARYMIEAAGYDGIKYWNDAEGSGYSWVVFSPEQIKSAETRGKMANNGNYDSRTEGRKDDIRYSVNEASPVRKDGEGILEYGQRVADWDDQKKLISEATKEQAEDAGVRYSIVEDSDLKKELDESKKVRVYRAMQVIDGKLYPPMAAMVDGEYVEPTEIGTWYESDERPELAKNGKFRLNKGNGKYVDAAYNPYFHSTTFPLNDQFKEAQNRPNLVVVEMEVPEYEAYPEKYADRERYKAEGAKDAVGALDWKAGDVQSQLTGTREVILTKHARVTGVLKPEEWAELVAPTLKENNVTMPSNVVTPEQRAVLESYGIPFVETNNKGELTQGEFAGEQYTWHYGKDAEKKRAEGLKKREKASEKKAVRYGADGVGTRGADVKYSVIGELGADEEKKRSLEMAKEMEKAKKRPLTIKKATGWERGADGKWRYEIGDLPVDESLLKDMKNNFFAYENQEDGLSTHQWLKKYGQGYGLSDLIEGSELLEDYPELGNVAVFVVPTNLSAYTAVDIKTGKPAFIVLNGMFDADHNIGSLNHEVQHVIQAYENFAYGAMPKDGGYRETAGEVEARNVRERMGMTDANRRSTLLSKTEDVDRADQNIVSFEQYLEDGRRKLGIAADDRKYSVDEGARKDGESLVDYAERMVDRQEKEKYDNYGRETLVKYSVADPFYSNAARGLESLQQKKATGEQWLAMLKNKGFLKAEEDEWSGLGEWLRSQKGSVTKEEVANYIAENTVKVEDWTYSEEAADISNNERMQALQSEFEELVWQGDEATGSIYTADWREWAYEQMCDKYGDDFRDAFEYNYRGELEPTLDYRDELSGVARYFLGLDGNNDKPINSTRLDYTTDGLQNKREIALVVPTIAPYNEYDDVHFGDAGEGRAVAWLRFGDAYDMDGKKVLVIDEVQSKRHQDGREKGYESQYASSAKAKFQKASDDMREWQKRMREKHGNFYVFDDLTEEERKEYNELYAIMDEASQYDSNNEPLNNVPDAPFKKNWMELAMKRALRYAAENGYDKVAWTSGEQQSKRYDIGGKVMSIDVAKVTVDDMTGEPVDSNEYFVYTTDTDGDLIDEAGGRMDAKKMESVFGKDIASKMIAQADEANGESVTIDGEDLHVGGEGMKGFYDKMIPSFMNKYCKKWGTQTGEVELSSVERAARKMHAVDVTEGMKESVMNGQPMYSINEGERRGVFMPGERNKCPEWRQAFRELYGDQQAIDILRDDHPRDIVEIASQVIYSGKLLWEDEGEGEYRQKGVKSMLGWSNGERVKFANLFRTRSHGGVSVQKMGERVEDMCRAEGVPFDEEDANAGLNAVIEVLRGSGSSSDVRNWIDLQRAQDARDYHEGWAGEFEYERDQDYLQRYGMTYDEYMDMMESVDDTVGMVKQGRATSALGGGRVKKASGVPVRDGSERPVIPEREEGESLLDYVQRIEGVEKAQRDWDKTHFTENQTEVEAREVVIKHIKQNLDSEDVKEMDKNTLTGIMRTLSNAKPENLGEMLEDAQKLVNHVAMKAQKKRVENLLNLKVQGRDQKNRSVAANVDDETRKVFAGLKETLNSVRTTGMEDDLHERRSKIWHIRAKASEEGRELTADEKSKIETLNEEIKELQSQQADVWEDIAAQGSVDVDKMLKEYEEKEELTDKENVRYKQLTIAQKIIEGEQALAEGYKLGTELRKAREAHRKALEDLKQENLSEAEHNWLDNQRKLQLARIRGLQKLISQSQAKYLDAMNGVEEILSDIISDGKNNLMREKEAERERKGVLMKGVIHDITGSGKELIDDDKENKKSDKTPWYKRPYASALSSFEYMAQKISTRTMGKDGFFYQHFVSDPETGVIAANNDYVAGMRKWTSMLDAKCKEMLGKDYQTMLDENSKKHTSTGVLRVITDKEGNFVRHEEMQISKDTAMYMYQLWKMPDGQAKLLEMGITEDTITECCKYAGVANIEFADWLQDVFLKEFREPLNAKYKEIYHTSMAEIENYVPIKIAKRALHQEQDMSGDTNTGQGSVQVKTGSLVNRTVNTKPIDLSRGAMDVVADHVNENQEFMSFAKVRQELGWVLSNTFIREQLKANGKGNFDRLLKASQIATRSYRPEEEEMDEWWSKAQKGLVGGNIAFRPTTALKQMLSVPAFYGYSQSPKYLWYLTKNIGWEYGANLPAVLASIGTFGKYGESIVKSAASGEGKLGKALSDNIRWCLDNVPNFRQRMLRGDAGEIHMDEKGLARWIDKKIQQGMNTNMMVDAITCSIGIKSIYDFEMDRAKERINEEARQLGLTGDAKAQYVADKTDDAHNRSIMKATVYYNATQQSNDAAFVSPLQVNKTLLSRTLTLYKNSPLGYARKFVESAKDLGGALNRSKRRRMIQEYADRYMAEGMGEADAYKEASKHVNNEARKSAMGMFLYGLVLNGLWNIGGKGFLGLMNGQSIAQKLLGSDNTVDDEELPSLSQSLQYISTLPMNGVPGNEIINYMTGIGVAWFNNEEKNFDTLGESILGQEIVSAMKKIDRTIKNDGLFSHELGWLVLQRASKFIGLDLQVAANTILAAERLVENDGWKDGDEFMIDLMLYLQSPEKQRADVAKNLFLDDSYSGEEYFEKVRKAMKYVYDDEFAYPGSNKFNEKAFDDLANELGKRLKIRADRRSYDAFQQFVKDLKAETTNEGKMKLIDKYSEENNPYVADMVLKDIKKQNEPSKVSKDKVHEKMYRAGEKAIGMTGDLSEERKMLYRFASSADIEAYEEMKTRKKELDKINKKYEDMAEKNEIEAEKYYDDHEEEFDELDELTDILSEINADLKEMEEGKTDLDFDDDEKIKEIKAKLKNFKSRHK